MTETFNISLADLERMVRQRVALTAARATALTKRRAQQEPSAWHIREEFDRDVIRGLPRWGRASRVARKTGQPLRTVTRLVARLNKLSQSV